MWTTNKKPGPFNLPYIAACAITKGAVGEEQFTSNRIADPHIHELAGKIKVTPDEGLDAIYPEGCRPTTIEIRTTDCKTYTSASTTRKGSQETS